jgi:hypothetical protein
MAARLLNHRVGAPKNGQRKGEANGIRVFVLMTSSISVDC